jgi:hypothetical protein
MATRRGELARRLADLERAKAAAPSRPSGVFRGEVVPGVAIWPPWNRVLTDEEWALLPRLFSRPERFRHRGGRWPDWRDGFRALCRDEAERATLEGIFAKEAALPAAEREMGGGLSTMFHEMAAHTAVEEDDQPEGEAG